MDKKKFIDELNIDGYSIKTDKGYKKVTKIFKTIKYKVYKLVTETHELKCADNHIVFDNNYNEIFVKDLQKDQIIMTETGPERILEIKETSDEENMFDISVDSDEHRYYTNGILSHNTTISAFYMLYESCFPLVKGDILIVAHKQSHAIEVLKRIKDMYYSMPLWLKPGLIKNNETSVEFDNGMRIIAEATTANAARGKTLKFVYCVDGKTNITIRNKKTKEIRKVNIEDLYFNDAYK